MSTIYKRILKELSAEQAFGYETDFKREELKLEKSHHNDAFIIAGGTTQERIEPLMIEQIRRHKRSMEQFYDSEALASLRASAKYIDKRTGEKVSGSILNSGRRTRNKNLNGENLRVYRGLKVSKGQRRIKQHIIVTTPTIMCCLKTMFIGSLECKI